MSALAIGGAMVIGAAVAAAQSPDSTAGPRVVRGRVIRGSTSGERPVPNQMVVLHRIGADSSGPTDSMATGARGEFRFSYTPRGDAVYLLSTSYGGVAYFSAPAQAADGPDAADLVVYDTTSRPVPVSLRGRHVIVSRPDNKAQRAVVEVFEISNDSVVTRVSGADSAAVWEVALPAKALRPRVGEGDVAAAAVTFTDGRARLFAPLQPGLRQLIVAYELPADAFPLALPLADSTTVLEVLLEEAGGSAQGAGLAAQEGVTVSGRQFARYLAQDAPAGATAQVSVPAVRSASGGTPAWLVPVLAALAAVIAAVLFFRRHPAPIPAPVATVAHASAVPNDGPARERDALARDLAALDAVYRDGIAASLPAEGVATPAGQEAYHRERARLKSRLAAVLEAEPRG